MPREPRCSQAELGKSLESSLNRKRQAFWKTREVRGPTHSWNLNFSITSLLQPSPTGAAPLGGPRAWWRAAVQGRGRYRGHESGGSVAADSPGGVCGVDRRRGGRVVCVPGPPVPGGEPDACGVPSAGCGLRAQSPAPGGGAQRREAERGHRAPRGRREERAWSPRDPPTPSGPPGPLLPTWSSRAGMGPCPCGVLTAHPQPAQRRRSDPAPPPGARGPLVHSVPHSRESTSLPCVLAAPRGQDCVRPDGVPEVGDGPGGCPRQCPGELWAGPGAGRPLASAAWGAALHCSQEASAGACPPNRGPPPAAGGSAARAPPPLQGLAPSSGRGPAPQSPPEPRRARRLPHAAVWARVACPLRGTQRWPDRTIPMT